MGVQRLISLLLLAVGLYLLGRDAAALFNGTGAGPEALDTLWRRLDSGSLSGFQSFVQGSFLRFLWDPGLLSILRMPAWTLPLGLGGLLLVLDMLSQRRGV